MSCPFGEPCDDDGNRQQPGAARPFSLHVFSITLPTVIDRYGTKRTLISMNFQILPERQDDAVLIEPLLDRTFGLDRQQRTVYRLRENLPPEPELSFVAVDSAVTLLASIRYWPIMIGTAPTLLTRALLLGPLAVEPRLQGRGIGKSLVRFSLDEARRLGHRICVVVGEPGYYRPYGFINAHDAGLALPGPVDLERFLVAALVPGALEGVQGLVGRASPQPLLAGNQ